MSSNILINVLDIYLDTENPRHDPINEQAKIIRHLVDKQRVKTLARHMCVNGVSPLDLIGLIKDENNNYIVVEGNRRLCSLLLLNDPSLAPSGEITYFKRLSLSSDKIPSSINCVLFENYEEAKEWMIVRHDGEQDGVGVRKWDAASKARNNLKNDRKDSNALTISLMDYSIEKGFLPTDNEDKIVTTASRYLGNPFFRKVFGIVSSRSEKNVLLNVPCREFDIMCEKFCSDLLQNTIVTSRSKKPDWEQYARTFSTAGIAPTQIVEVHSLSECLIASVKVEDRENNSGHDEIENSEIDNFPLVESPNKQIETLARAATIEEINDVLRSKFIKNTIVGISLKKMSGKTAQWELVNIEKTMFAKLPNYKLGSVRCKLDVDKKGNVSSTDSVVEVLNGTTVAGTFQIRQNSKGFNNLKVEASIKGAGAARAGKVPLDMLATLMSDYKSTLNNKHQNFPKNAADFKKRTGEFKKYWKKIKDSCDTNIKDKEFESNILAMYKKSPDIAMSKLMQLDFLNQLFCLPDSGKKRRDYFVKSMYFLAQKKGNIFGPFGKLY